MKVLNLPTQPFAPRAGPSGAWGHPLPSTPAVAWVAPALIHGAHIVLPPCDMACTVRLCFFGGLLLSVRDLFRFLMFGFDVLRFGWFFHLPGIYLFVLPLMVTLKAGLVEAAGCSAFPHPYTSLPEGFRKSQTSQVKKPQIIQSFMQQHLALQNVHTL